MDFHQISEFLIKTAHAATESIQHAEPVVAEVAQHAAEAGDDGVLGTLGINLKLFIAQLVNFGVILLVLWKWVFNPVAKKLTERTEKIEKSLNDAGRIETEKQEFQTWREEEMSKARSEAYGVISKASSDAQIVQTEVLQKTKEEQTKLVEQAKAQIESEKNLALEQAKGELAEIVTAATEKILRKKLDDKEDDRLIKESLKSI
ncbi:MAG: ATP synthase F0 subunit B [Candidatus Doudnabacteria bacterium CG10_big_fil_rev_8_21_14_0_10_42_18]|uniref:ATP synthase subunit b n=1 Tax=Candidatus Doudnabacteria bacterium CG10_big_fil_rev_8_21_14_0_10_42_18 TaxID=1974552 RepID=A0A2H0VAV7_9BACT|nr:MAG: ATP synthase F0 subunit B [Candidatus Doudnabacteria bacterium CG10_big_fil_rev_8_21_14_0_10_42_18]